MESSTNVSHTHSHSSTEGCHHNEKSTCDILMSVVDKILAIAIGIFAAYKKLQLFLPFLFFGICIGIYSYIQNKESCEHTHSPSSCAHGLIEQLTGVKLPLLISRAADITVTVCHIDHHAIAFVPIIGISLGKWIGEMGSYYAVLVYRKISVHSAPSPNVSFAH